MSKNMVFEKAKDSADEVPKLSFNFNKPIVIHLPHASVTHSVKVSSQKQTREKKQDQSTELTVSSSVETPPKNKLLRQPTEQDLAPATQSELEPVTQSTPVTHSTPMGQPSPIIHQEIAPTTHLSDAKEISPLKHSSATTQQPITSKPLGPKTKKTPRRFDWSKNPPSSSTKSNEKKIEETVELSECMLVTPTLISQTKDIPIPPEPESIDHKYKIAESSKEEAESTQRRRSARVAAKSNDDLPTSVKKVLSRKSDGTSILKKNHPRTSTPKQKSSFGYPTDRIVNMANRHKSFINRVVDELKNWGEFARKRLSSD